MTRNRVVAGHADPVRSLGSGASPTVRQAELWRRLRDAVRTVAREQPELWDFKSSEWAIVAQVFHQLRSMRWPDRFSVDNEWDREGRDGRYKRCGIGGTRADGDRHGRPDVIVHRRGDTTPAGNLLVVEFKRDSLDSNAALDDRAKVLCLMKHFGYTAGAVVSLGSGDEPGPIRAWWLTSRGGEPVELAVPLGTGPGQHRGNRRVLFE